MSFLNVVIMEINYQMSAASNQEGGEGSDMDEPMASQGQVKVRFLEKIKTHWYIDYVLHFLQHMKNVSIAPSFSCTIIFNIMV